MNTIIRDHSSEQRQQVLLEVFLPNMRQRFKNEVNRLTSGAMRKLLGEQADTDDLTFFMSYLYIYHWLRYHVHEDYRAGVLETFRGPKFSFLMDLLLLDKAEDFIKGYINYWLRSDAGPVQREQLLRLYRQHASDPDTLYQYVLQRWQALGVFQNTYMVDFKGVAREERDRYSTMLGEEDLQRLHLIDAMDDVAQPEQRFSKLGIIPAMGCPQTCRHCMFTWRPPKPKNEDPDLIYQWVDSLTDSVLFTGGDLTKQLDYFYDAIAKMRHVRNFAILLNGDFADSPKLTNEILGKMAQAVKSRPKKWPQAKVLLQISFDEFHQEVYVDKHGLLDERIPVSKIANIVERYPKYTNQIQLALLHKQTSLNFSQDIFQKGVFARLAKELKRRGYQVQVLDMQASSRLKRNPLDAEQPAQVLKDATFILDKHANAPILLTSSTIDGYGRAALLDEWETVKEKDLLQQVIEQGPPTGESFDIDMMFWFNGWVTLFNAVHVCLGDIYQDGLNTILQRHAKDPLLKALNCFDRRLLDFYTEIHDDLAKQIEQATGPHHLFHALTEDPKVRLHMTQRLLEAG
jgi:hypothetical protein